MCIINLLFPAGDRGKTRLLPTVASPRSARHSQVKWNAIAGKVQSTHGMGYITQVGKASYCMCAPFVDKQDTGCQIQVLCLY